MKKIYFLLSLLTATLCSCTNNGDIGDYYGLWAVDKVTRNGEVVEDYPYGRVYFKFQTEDVVINFQTDDDHTRPAGWLGTWKEQGKNLIFDFDQWWAPDSPCGQIWPEVLMPPQQVTVVRLEHLSSRSLKISFTDPSSGDILRFCLRKII